MRPASSRRSFRGSFAFGSLLAGDVDLFVGGGVGIGQTQYQTSAPGSKAPTFVDTGAVLVRQAAAGIRLTFSNRWLLRVEARELMYGVNNAATNHLREQQVNDAFAPDSLRFDVISRLGAYVGLGVTL